MVNNLLDYGNSLTIDLHPTGLKEDVCQRGFLVVVNEKNVIVNDEETGITHQIPRKALELFEDFPIEEIELIEALLTAYDTVDGDYSYFEISKALKKLFEVYKSPEKVILAMKNWNYDIFESFLTEDPVKTFRMYH